MNVTYPTKMEWYKILARTLLMLSVIEFALAAPVVVQEHEVRVNVVPANAVTVDRTNAPPIRRSLDFPGHSGWREQEPRQHNPRWRTDSNGLPEPSNIDLDANNPPSLSPPPGPGSTSPSESPTSHWQARTDEPDPLNPSSPHDGSIALNPTLPSASRPLSPEMDYESGLDAFSQPSPLKFKSVSDLMSTPTHGTQPLDGSSQISSSVVGYESGLDAFSQPNTLKFKSVSELMPTPIHTPPLDDTSQISSSDESYSTDSYAPTDSGSLSSESWSSHPSSPDQLSTGESKPPAPGPTANQPLPASPLNPEPSTEQDPPPSAKRPRPEVNEFEGSLTKILKGKFKRRISGFGALHVAQ